MNDNVTNIFSGKEKPPEQAAKDRLAQAFWATFLLQPVAILFLWNVGVASIAHVQTFGSYWPLLAFSLGINMFAAILTSVRRYSK